MSREIKFRDYELIKNEMRYFDLDSYDRQDHNSYGNLTQFTGLRDKNGVEIFEGDVYCYPNDFPKSVESTPFEISEVIFIEGAFRIGDYLLSEYKEEGEVIGNIFENPELLEDSHE